MDKEAEVYYIEYPENYRAELVRSKLKVIDKTYTEEYISENLVRLHIKYDDNPRVVGYCFVYQIPSEFGNIDTEYMVGDIDKFYKERQLEKSYKRLSNDLDDFFDVLDEGIDSVVKVYGPGTKEVMNYVDFLNKLDSVTATIIHDLPSILSNFY